MFGLEVIQSEWKEMSKIKTRTISRPKKRTKPKVKIHTDGNPVTPLSERNRYIFSDLIPTIKKIQRKKSKIETRERSARLNAAKKEIKGHAREIYNNLLARKTPGGQSLLDGLTPKVKKQVFEFIESKLSATYFDGITNVIKMNIQQEANGLIHWIKDHREKSVVKKELISKIKYYEELKKQDRDKINELINYNLSLITNKPYLSAKQSAELNKTICKALIEMGFPRIYFR